jgi:hypothetical protein
MLLADRGLTVTARIFALLLGGHKRSSALTYLRSFEGSVVR